MLKVATSAEALSLIKEVFGGIRTASEQVAVSGAVGRILREDVCAPEDVPGFVRSAVDGYAVCAADTFGCSESIPALLDCVGQVEMGRSAAFDITRGQCAYVPTGGELPAGADAMVMIEHADDYGDGTVGILKASPPGSHCIFRGDDVSAGELVLKAGRRLRPHDAGTLSVMGVTCISAARRPVVGVLSTGDELVTAAKTPEPGQIRDVNAPLLCAAAEEAGAKAVSYGICGDDPGLIKQILKRMAEECDIVLLSGGTSVGIRDAAPRIIEELGRVLLHGIAIKPGKPTILGEIAGRPVFGMPGHPVAAYFVFRLFVGRVIADMLGAGREPARPLAARLSRAIPSNHGREECVAVSLEAAEDGYAAVPVAGKSGLITLLSRADGYIRVQRDAEGLAEGQQVEVELF